jgi:hypothetical protein
VRFSFGPAMAILEQGLKRIDELVLAAAKG